MRLQKFTSAEVEGFVDDITAEMAKKVMKRLREEVGKKASNCQLMRMERKERVR